LEVKAQGQQGQKTRIHETSWLPGTDLLLSDLYGDRSGHSEFGAAALLKAVWWDLRLASLLTHLFWC